MIPLLFLVFCLSLLGMILLADHVKNRFRHTPNSRRILGGEAFAAVAAAAVATGVLWPRLGWPARLGLTFLLAIPVYIIVAFLTVEAWRHRKQEGFDREIALLNRECNRWQRELERLNWELKDLERQKLLREEEGQRLAARLRALEDQLQAWETSVPGNDRSRRIEAWMSEFTSLPDEALQARKEALLARVAAPGGDGGELGARLNLLDLVLVRRAFVGPGGPAAELEQRLAQVRESWARADRRLTQLKEELQRWQEKKTAFLREKIPLD